MKRLLNHFALIVSVFLLTCKVSTGQSDTLRVYLLNPILIESTSNIGNEIHKIEKGNYADLLNKNGFSLISKGVFFAQDIYADGFKRGDINVIIDGERYHNACPNRMDPPLTRINPISMSSLSLYKSNTTLQSGFAGSVEFKRNNPEKLFKFKSGISVSQGHTESFDGYLNANYWKNDIGLRYSFGKPYSDGENRDYKTLYGYKDNYSYSFADVTFNGIKGYFKYGLSYSHSKNISFPYLQMDEIYNNVLSANLAFKSYKIYFNYTNHLMTNELRIRSSEMETKANNFTLGIFNDFLEFYFRNWLSDNNIVMGNNIISNKAIPNLRQYSLTAKKMFLFDNFKLNVKAGGLVNVIGVENNDYYSLNFGDTKNTSVFYRLTLSGGFDDKLSHEISYGTLIEFSTEAPEPENQYIAIRRPGNNAWWSGNPNLNNPTRLSLRAMFTHKNANFELYGNYVYNYVNLAKSTVSNRNFLTYKNINAYIVGANINLNYKYFSSEISFTIGQNITTNIPLSEIAPLRVTSNVFTPQIYGINIFITHIYNNAQTRVDETLFEIKSNTYNVFNIGLNFDYKKLNFMVEIRNVLNNSYYNSLSYARNPYSSGARIFESGRYIAAGILFSL